MEPLDYIKTFHLDQGNDFDREPFIQALGQEFLDYCKNTQLGRNTSTGKLYYFRFKEIVKNFEIKFRGISQLRQQLSTGIQKPLSRKLWNAFFAIYVVPYREEHFQRERALMHGREANP